MMASRPFYLGHRCNIKFQIQYFVEGISMPGLSKGPLKKSLASNSIETSCMYQGPLMYAGSACTNSTAGLNAALLYLRRSKYCPDCRALWPFPSRGTSTSLDHLIMQSFIRVMNLSELLSCSAAKCIIVTSSYHALRSCSCN